MNTPTSVLLLKPEDLTPVQKPVSEPRIAAQSGEPRRVNNLTLVDGKTFLACTLAGDIAPPCSTDVGFFYRDTRFLSHYELRVNGHRTVVLSSSTQKNLVSQIDLTTSNIVIRDSLDLPENTVHIRRDQILAGRFFDRLTLRNFNLQPAELELDIQFDADFADVFQVRGVARRVMGTFYEPVARNTSLSFAYKGRDGNFRQTLIEFDPAPSRLNHESARYNLTLAPGERRQLLISVRPLVNGESPDGWEPHSDFQSARAESANAHGDNGRSASPAASGENAAESQYETALQARWQSFRDWESRSTTFESSNDLFDACLHTAASDFFALRIPYGRDGEIIAAGVPWFATIFGRDSLIAGYQSLMLHPHLAKQTLRFLAHHQGQKVDTVRDEEPGKILHEMREGEMTLDGEMPFSPYYGSVDSTPLFIVALSETYNWTGDDALLEELLPAARRAMEWIENYGDLDGDGFVEYSRRSERGLANQGWKDSWDSSLQRDGRLLEPPIALCEVQGYCFDARYRLSRLLRVAGDSAGADRLRKQTTELARRFEAAYWMPDQGYYAMALDGEKRHQRVIASNAGHLLWSRIVGRERARQVMRRLMRDDMFSGWGIRTLSADENTFNPLSYHRGSVWPHDNSLIGQGLAFNDGQKSLERLFTAIFHAATHFRNQRLPELYVGTARREFEEPVHYPVSCSPQAWASGAFFLLLTSILGLRPNAAEKELRIVNPALPSWLNWLRIRNLQIGNSQVTLEFSRRDQRTFCNVIDVDGDKLLVSIDFLKR
jgi:glycogen debranching enzyme